MKTRCVALGISLAVCAAVPTSAAAPREAPESPRDALARMHRAAGVEIETVLNERSSTVLFLSVPSGSSIPVSAAKAFAPADQIAQAFLNDFGPAFGLQHDDFKIVGRSGVDEVGMEHIRVQQTHHGVPVTGAEVMVHLREDGVIAASSTTIPIDDTLGIEPRLDAESAKSAVRSYLVKHLGVGEAQLRVPRLEVFDRGVLEGGGFYSVRLAWFVEAVHGFSRRYFWVDSDTGAVLLQFDQAPSALNRQVYDAQSSDQLPGTLVRNEGGAAAGDSDTDLVYDFSGDTYWYFRTTHGRDSFDGQGAALISSVHYCDPEDTCPGFPNAYWSPNLGQFVYGDGFPAADDVVAHEITHAVTSYTANLFYYMQSGALNEAFSDIFGETVDLTNGRGNDSTSVRWIIGEDLASPSLAGPLRDMLYPTDYWQPGRMSDPEFECSSGFDDENSDSGGVHTNNGVPNHAFALMVDGGSYNGFTIRGIGLDKAAKIQYRTLTRYLTSGTTFLHYYFAVQSACSDLVSSTSITESDCSEVKRALDAVELFRPWPCSPDASQFPPLCDHGDTYETVFYDSFENMTSSPWESSISETHNHWHDTPAAWYAINGERSMWGEDADVAGSSLMAMTQDVALPTGDVRMRFSHAYAFESDGNTGYDGGLVAFSNDGGQNWSNGGPLITAGATYAGSLASGTGNPLADQTAFFGESFGFTSTRFDLSQYGGQNLRVSFWIGTDSSIGDLGWLVDDVHIYRCVDATPTCSYTLSPTQASFGAGGSSSSFAVNTTSGCSWTATASRSWVHITGGATGSGSGTVSFRVDSNTGSSQRSATIHVADQSFSITQSGASSPPPSASYSAYAVIARTSGANNSVWQSSLSISNVSSTTANATVTYRYSNSGSVSRNVTIPAFGMVEWADAAVDLFDVAGKSSGVVTIQANHPVLAAVRTFNSSSRGSFGQSLPGASEAESMEYGEVGIISPVRRSSSFRTNIGLINTGTVNCSATVYFANSNGYLVGSPLSVNLAPGAWKQINEALDAAGINRAEGVYALIDLETPGAKLWAYGTVIDNSSGDPTALQMKLMQSVGEDRHYAVIAHTTGANNSVWQSSLSICNSSAERARVNLSYRYGGGRTSDRTVTIPAYGMAEWDDAPVDLFGVGGKSSGVVVMDVDEPVVVSVRTFNSSAGGTFGQSLPSAFPSRSMTYDQFGIISPVRRTQSFRTNIGVINTGAVDCKVLVYFVDKNGDYAGDTITVNLAPGAWKQINETIDKAGISYADGLYAIIQLETPGAKVWAYGTVIDNASGDPTALEMAIVE